MLSLYCLRNGALVCPCNPAPCASCFTISGVRMNLTYRTCLINFMLMTWRRNNGVNQFRHTISTMSRKYNHARLRLLPRGSLQVV